MSIPNLSTTIKVVIAQDAQQSGVFPLEGGKILAIGFPAAFTGATVTLLGHVDPDATGYTIVDKDGNAISLTASVDKVVLVPSELPVRFVSIYSASAEAAARTLNVFFK